MHAIRRELRGSAIALAMVAATTLVAYMLIQWFDVRRGSVIYLLPVLLAGWHLGLVPALVAAVAGVLWSGYLFFSPYYSFYLAQPKEILNLLLFMVVAVVTSHLANSMKTQTEIARKREGEMSNLYAFSRRLASSSSAADIYLAIEEHLASLVQRKVVLFGAGAAGDPDGANPDQDALSQRLHTAIADVQAARLRTRWTTAPAISGWSAASRRRMPTSASSPSISAACRQVSSRTSASALTTCCPMPPPRWSASMWRAPSMTRRCGPRPNCCGKR